MEDVNAKLETLMQQLNSRIFPRKMECSYNPNDTMAMFNFFFIDFVEKVRKYL